jgi:alpha-glutamyl/putrescinyl thymine pyrophosphorylase clade 1
VQPTRRDAVYDTYWRLAAERNAIFLRRARGEKGPWTQDPILRRYKFCNAFRAADRVTQYLIREVIYGSAADGLAPEDVFLRIVLFRLFSKESTWAALERATGGLTLATFDTEALGSVLESLKSRQSIYTAAFILADPSVFGHGAKHRNHLELVSSMFRTGSVSRNIARAKSLKDVYEVLIGEPGIGPFLGYQIAIDLNYSEELDFCENDFTMPGPGALRGLQKVFTDAGDKTPQQLILEMVERQDEEFARLGLEFSGLFGRPLHAIDCQNLFCETDKYSRQAFPELKSNRVRIKQEFRPSSSPLKLFFPPKWGLCEAATASDGAPLVGQTSLQLAGL